VINLSCPVSSIMRSTGIVPKPCRAEQHSQNCASGDEQRSINPGCNREAEAGHHDNHSKDKKHQVRLPHAVSIRRSLKQSGSRSWARFAGLFVALGGRASIRLIVY
jgi:hypothetical protein